jgi:hypothetical protein
MAQRLTTNCGGSLITTSDGNKPRRKTMNEYEFTLKFQLADPQVDPIAMLTNFMAMVAMMR